MEGMAEATVSPETCGSAGLADDCPIGRTDMSLPMASGWAGSGEPPGSWSNRFAPHPTPPVPKIAPQATMTGTTDLVATVGRRGTGAFSGRLGCSSSVRSRTRSWPDSCWGTQPHTVASTPEAAPMKFDRPGLRTWEQNRISRVTIRPAGATWKSGSRKKTTGEGIISEERPYWGSHEFSLGCRRNLTFSEV